MFERCSQAGKEARGESQRVSVCGSLSKKGGPFLSLLKTKCTKPAVVAERDKSVGLREGLLVRVTSSEIQHNVLKEITSLFLSEN